MTIVADAIDGLFDLLDGHTWTSVDNADDLKVFDGPPVVDRSTLVEVWVGANGTEQDDDGARHAQRWTSYGGGSGIREEAVDIPGAIWVIGGEVDMRTRRRTASDVLEEIAVLVHGSDLGVGAVLCGGAELVEGTCRQLQTPDGAAVHWSFTVRATARIEA